MSYTVPENLFGVRRNLSTNHRESWKRPFRRHALGCLCPPELVWAGSLSGCLCLPELVGAGPLSGCLCPPDLVGVGSLSGCLCPPELVGACLFSYSRSWQLLLLWWKPWPFSDLHKQQVLLPTGQAGMLGVAIRVWGGSLWWQQVLSHFPEFRVHHRPLSCLRECYWLCSKQATDSSLVLSRPQIQPL